MKKNSRKGFVATACVLVLALIAGPGCAGLCVGVNCASAATTTGKDGGCHHVELAHGPQFSRAANIGACNADAVLAIAGKPTVAIQAGTAVSPERPLAVTGAIFSRTDCGGANTLVYPGGCSPGAVTAKPASSILRI